MKNESETNSLDTMMKPIVERIEDTMHKFRATHGALNKEDREKLLLEHLLKFMRLLHYIGEKLQEQ